VTETRIKVGGETICIDHTRTEVEILAIGSKGGRLWGAYVTPDAAREVGRALWVHADHVEEAP
jgi:hypothetical protein